MEPMTILLVDDEPRYLKTTARLIEKKGYGVFTAQSGQAALDILASHSIHVVILDAKMPGMDGMATLRTIKRLHPLVEVMMLTGHATADAAVEGLNAGACDYLVKPMDVEELIEKSLAAYGRRKAIEEKIRSIGHG
jgi:DNA-binding response OmpR family regulator